MSSVGSNFFEVFMMVFDLMVFDLQALKEPEAVTSDGCSCGDPWVDAT
jgi:hypothetical protein